MGRFPGADLCSGDENRFHSETICTRAKPRLGAQLKPESSPKNHNRHTTIAFHAFSHLIGIARPNAIAARVGACLHEAIIRRLIAYMPGLGSIFPSHLMECIRIASLHSSNGVRQF